ncbi:RNA recognition motif domain-containing protein [Rhizoctonia solani AG-1 IA]|uniref:RNA recognition motif domain-containing protein n=1 Tax=Thanatephorus cucumeris (strain AG1-IA) TaxID=983506 RepID=L8X4Y6_THACA|nr:RNA recognition motif domain-containing protein [Rhizoctonia solani AG-1 IA]
MDYSGYYNQGYTGGSGDSNPYHKPYQPSAAALAWQQSGSSSRAPANAYEYDVGAAAQGSAYVPGAMLDKKGGSGGKLAKGGKRTTVLRKGAGKVWEDQTLLEWDSSWSRLFVGDLSNDVSDDVLANAFNKYPSFQKAKVIRDRLSQKAKYGFVAFSDPEDFLKAWKDMDGTSPLPATGCNRPVKLKRADAAIRPVEIGHRKARQLDKDRKNNKHKPY